MTSIKSSGTSGLRAKLEAEGMLTLPPKMGGFKPEPSDFSPPPMEPMEVPELWTLPEADVWAFLNDINPFDDLEFLALHVSQITVGLSELKRRIEALETERDSGGRK